MPPRRPRTQTRPEKTAKKPRRSNQDVARKELPQLVAIVDASAVPCAGDRPQRGTVALASPPSREMCEAVLQATIPLLASRVSEALTAKFDETTRRILEAQAAQTVALQKLEATLETIRRPHGSEADSGAGCREAQTTIIDLDAVEEKRGSVVRVTEFMNANWRAEWSKAGVDVKSFLVQYSTILKTRVTHMRGPAIRRGAPNMVYTTRDLPVMKAVLDELLPMIADRVGRKETSIGNNRCDLPRTQRQIHQFFKIKK